MKINDSEKNYLKDGNEVEIISAFESRTRHETKNVSILRPSTHNRQQKLTKMNDYIQRFSSKENFLLDSTGVKHDDLKIIDVKTTNEKLQTHTEAKIPVEPPKTAWKIKAIIDNRNFLIPIT